MLLQKIPIVLPQKLKLILFSHKEGKFIFSQYIEYLRLIRKTITHRQIKRFYIDIGDYICLATIIKLYIVSNQEENNPHLIATQCFSIHYLTL